MHTAGSLSTWRMCGLASSMACICGLLVIMSRRTSGLLIRLCIMGEFIIWRAASGSRISAWACACIEAAEKGEAAPAPAPAPDHGEGVPAPKGDAPGNIKPLPLLVAAGGDGAGAGD